MGEGERGLRGFLGGEREGGVEEMMNLLSSCQALCISSLRPSGSFQDKVESCAAASTFDGRVGV